MSTDEIQLSPAKPVQLPALLKDQINEQVEHVELQDKQLSDSVVTDEVADADAAGGPPQKRLRKKADLEKRPTTSNNVVYLDGHEFASDEGEMKFLATATSDAKKEEVKSSPGSEHRDIQPHDGANADRYLRATKAAKNGDLEDLRLHVDAGVGFMDLNGLLLHLADMKGHAFLSGDRSLSRASRAASRPSGVCLRWESTAKGSYTSANHA